MRASVDLTPNILKKVDDLAILQKRKRKQMLEIIIESHFEDEKNVVEYQK